MELETTASRHKTMNTPKDSTGGRCPPPPCSACAEAHAILDADASKIIRNAKDGYPEGREPRELTLAERVKALCIYACDWKRWCEEADKPNDEMRDRPRKTSHEAQD